MENLVRVKKHQTKDQRLVCSTDEREKVRVDSSWAVPKTQELSVIIHHRHVIVGEIGGHRHREAINPS